MRKKQIGTAACTTLVCGPQSARWLDVGYVIIFSLEQPLHHLVSVVDDGLDYNAWSNINYVTFDVQVE